MPKLRQQNKLKTPKNDLEYLESTLAAIETSDTESDLNAIRAELLPKAI